MKKLKTIALSLALILGLAATPLIPATVSAQPANNGGGGGNSGGGGGGTSNGGGGSPASDIQSGVSQISNGGQGGQADFMTGIKNIVNMLLFLLGMIAVIMIVIGGFRYVTSNGDAGATKAAKDTIMYAVIGLVVAIMAYAIVNFVITAFAPKN